MNPSTIILYSYILICCLLVIHPSRCAENPANTVISILDLGAIPNDAIHDTTAIQNAFDTCSANGGGTVRFPKGKFLSGGLTIPPKVNIYFEEGSILQGSENHLDYPSGWTGAFIQGKDLDGARIEGKGIIDGVNCVNPKGEEGFRGPHCFSFSHSKNLVIQDISITQSANYALIFRSCQDVSVERVSIRGGHDGLNAWDSSNFTIQKCDFRTGDDAIAGTNNQNFLVQDCQLNSSCNGFRFSCLGLTVRNCHIWGPGESIHRVSKRNNMLSAFVHFSPQRGGSLESGDWLIEDVTIENAIHLYLYDYKTGQWQTGKPARSVRMKNIAAKGIQQPITIIGDGDFSLFVEDSIVNFANQKINNEHTPAAEESEGYAFRIRDAKQVDLVNVRVSNLDEVSLPVLSLETIETVHLKHFDYSSTTHAEPIQAMNVREWK